MEFGFVMIIRGNILNVFTDEVYPGEIYIEHGIIQSIKEVDKEFNDIIVPGFIDAHTHIESSLITPSRFAEVALKHGTTSIVTDCRELANVMGMDGVWYLVDDASSAPLNYYFTAPSSVSSNDFETRGGVIGVEDLDCLLSRDNFVGLSEVLDYDAVINKDKDVLDKISLAQKYNKPVDGYAPNLGGHELQEYFKAGIGCDSLVSFAFEVNDRRRLGVKTMIREGSNVKRLESLINTHADFIVSDELRCEDLVRGHMNNILRKAVDLGFDPFEAIRMVTLNPAEYYGINAGAIAPNRRADLVFIDNLDDFRVHRVVINGNTIFKKHKLLYRANPKPVNDSMNVVFKRPEDFDLKVSNANVKSATVNVIDVLENSAFTTHNTAKLNVEKGCVIPSVFEDVLKISVVDRYGGNNISHGFVRGFGLKNGAIASSVAHDCHNIVVVGTDSKYMAEATNAIIESNGGLVGVSNTDKLELSLPIAGLMSDRPAYSIAKRSNSLNRFVYDMGSNLSKPFTSLSFMCSSSFPSLKITDKGLFDVDKREFVDVIISED